MAPHIQEILLETERETSHTPETECMYLLYTCALLGARPSEKEKKKNTNTSGQLIDTSAGRQSGCVKRHRNVM